MITLGVFFTRGVSLKKWVETGLFEREVLIYHAHLKTNYFSKIYWFTYGYTDTDIAINLKLSNLLSKQIEIIPCPFWFSWMGRASSLLYSIFLPIFIMRYARLCDVFKTNQMDGALAAILTSRINKKPLYLRTGFTFSLFVEKIYKLNIFRRAYAWLIEKISFTNCSASSVSSMFDKSYILKRYNMHNNPPYIIGNYVDMESFSPSDLVRNRSRMIFVGRITKQKNLAEAILATHSAGIGLDIVGDGQDKESLQKLVFKLNANVKWLGVISNQKLPILLKEYRYFFLPSLWEGMPKVLIEAMALGMTCICNNATGINELIEDGVTGYLSNGYKSEELAKAIRRAIDEDNIEIGLAARRFVSKNFSLEAIVNREQEIFNSIMKLNKSENGRS